jgi:hypothetical protein
MSVSPVGKRNALQDAPIGRFHASFVGLVGVVGYRQAESARKSRRDRRRARLALPATPLPTLATDGRPRQTAAEDRRRLRPRARRLRLGDRHRPTTPHHLKASQPLGLEQRMRPTTRRTLESSMRHPPVTRNLRPRQLPTVTSHAVPTGECQSDPPSLPRTHRCSRPRGQPLDRASPLDLSLHVRTRIEMNPTLPLGCRVQPRESESNSSYFAGRNATWSTKATPATGWNE